MPFLWFLTQNGQGIFTYTLNIKSYLILSLMVSVIGIYSRTCACLPCWVREEVKSNFLVIVWKNKYVFSKNSSFTSNSPPPFDSCRTPSKYLLSLLHCLFQDLPTFHFSYRSHLWLQSILIRYPAGWMESVCMGNIYSSLVSTEISSWHLSSIS